LENVGVGAGIVGVAVDLSVTVAVEVGSINVGVGVYVLIRGLSVELDVGAGVDADAGSVAEVITIGRAAATLGGMNIPVKRRPVILIPMKSPIDRDLVSARFIMILIATINFRKWFPIE
jgi:hypothetical protein